MIQKSFTFPRSTERTQTHRINLPQLTRVLQATATNGSVRIAAQSGDEVTLEFSGGSGESVQTGSTWVPGDSKTVSMQKSAHYNSGGYSGTLTRYVAATAVRDSTQEAFNNSRAMQLANQGYPHDIETYNGIAYGKIITYAYQGTVSRSGHHSPSYTTYYTYGVNIQYDGNDVPVISGEDRNLGAKNDAFDISYQVTDKDNVKVIERLNGTTIRSLDNAPKGETLTISISREKLFSLPLNSDNVIEISADDGKGGVAYRRYTFRRTNSAPQISGEDTDLGQKAQTFAVSFSATDQENDAMSAKIFLGDKLLKTYDSLVSAQENSFPIPKLEFVQLPRGAHRVRIEVQDKNAATSMRNLSFNREVGRLSYKFTRETDQKAKQIIIAPTWFVAEGATAKVEVCNNALDASPSWENMTEEIQNDRAHTFTNQEKTAEHWAVGVKITIERAQATATSWLAGFGGAYK